MFVALYLHIGPSSSSLSNAQAPVVPNVAHSCKEHITNWTFMLCDIGCQLHIKFRLHLNLIYLILTYAVKVMLYKCWSLICYIIYNSKYRFLWLYNLIIIRLKVQGLKFHSAIKCNTVIDIKDNSLLSMNTV